MWRIRQIGDEPPVYSTTSEFFTCVIHYGGKIVNEKKTTQYIGGEVGYVDMINVDQISWLELEDMLENLGHEINGMNCFWLKPRSGLSDGLRKLNDDNTILDMVANLASDYYAHVYMEKNGIVNFDTNVNSESNGNTDSEDPNYEESAFEDSSDCSMDYDDEFFQDEVDLVLDSSKTLIGGFPTSNISEDEGSDTSNSHELRSPREFDDDEISTKKFPEFNEAVDMDNPKFEEEMVFTDRGLLKRAVKQYGRMNRLEVKFEKNDKQRLKVVCKAENCPWNMWASPLDFKDEEETRWQIKTMKYEHNCGKATENRNYTARWLAEHYLDNFKVDPNWPPSALQAQVRKDFFTIVNHQKCSRARDIAKSIINGNFISQFDYIYDYIDEVKHWNPGSTMICYRDASLFQRMYVCLGPCKKGFEAGCRPFICLDGCFLKGIFGGQLLCAVAIDPNNCMYPLAYAVVESENKDSWSWFLSLLIDDLNIVNTHGWGIMSDKQKGLIQAVEELLPNSEHRFCVRHLYNNFRTNHKGVTLRDILWKAARSSYVEQFEEAMIELRIKSPDAADWLAEKHPSHWSRAYFRTWTKVDMLVNNLSESFNSLILDARDKPILTLMDSIRCKLMKKIAKRSEVSKKWPGPFCPNIMKKIEKLKEYSAKYFPEPAGGSNFEVEFHGNKHVVKLGSRTCTCRKWDLRGIPCVHAVTAILYNRENIFDYIDPCYKVETYINIYSNFISPIRGPPQWKRSDMPPMKPPTIRRAAGRPKKARRKAADEKEKAKGKMGRKGVRIKCSRCGKVEGHNKRTCKPEPTPSEVSDNQFEELRRDTHPKVPITDQPSIPSSSVQNSSRVQSTTRWFANGSSQTIYTSLDHSAPVTINHSSVHTSASLEERNNESNKKNVAAKRQKRVG